jgi:ATP-binding cassette, subfamily B, bacterial PglK
LLLLVLMVIASFAEIISIGAVLPFLGVLTSPDRIFALTAAQPIIQFFNLTSPEKLLLPITIMFASAALIAGTARLVLFWASTRLSFATGADLSISIYRRTLFQPYSVHCARNSSEVINGISTKANSVIYGVVFPFLMLISSSILLIAILVILLMVEPIIALIAFGGFGMIYVVIVGLTRRLLVRDSQCIAKESTQAIKALQEGLGGIRDILINGNQTTYCRIYRNADLPLRRAQGNHMFIGQSPRYAVEALGTILIAVLAFILSQQQDGLVKAIPILGALAVGAQRLLPVLQSTYGSWTSIRGHQAILSDVINLLEQPLPQQMDLHSASLMPFTKTISFSQVGFRYSEQTPFVLRQINLEIIKGSRVGFIGATGSGKSTLLDIVMALLEPTEGGLQIDGQTVVRANQLAWQKHIAHVPQTIFLTDGTIEENIAFGIAKEDIDNQRVRLAAQQAQIAESIEGWPLQYQTLVGERGIRLSGGQRQRIGIARALYKQADVIIFDEATSALDNETEQAVMQAIESLSQDLTLLIIAHRLTTLKNCTQIVELGDGRIKRAGSYHDIVNQAAPVTQENKESNHRHTGKV